MNESAHADIVATVIRLGRGTQEHTEQLVGLLDACAQPLAAETDDRRVVLATLALQQAYYESGRYHEFAQLLSRALGKQVERALRLELVVLQAKYLYTYNDYALTLSTLEELELEPGDAPIIGISKHEVMAASYSRLGRHDEALRECHQGLALARRAMVYERVTNLLNVLAIIHRAMGHYSEAIEALDEAIHINHKFLRDQLFEMVALLNMSSCYISQHDYARARATITRLLDRPEVATSQELQAFSLGNLAKIALLEASLARAEELADQAIALHDEGGRAFHISPAHVVIAICRALAGAADADAAIERAYRVARFENKASSIDELDMVLHLVCARPEQPPEYTRTSLWSRQVWEALVHGGAPPQEAELTPFASMLFRRLNPESTLYIRGEMEAVRVHGAWIELGRRRVAKRLLRALVEAYPEQITAWDLFEQTWPGVDVHDAEVLNRLYTAIHRLRALGLDDVIAHEGDGYRLRSLQGWPPE